MVPPSRDLPPPWDQPAPTAAWPKGSPKTIKHVRAKGEVVPETAVENPNPPFQKKPWYNPAGWFSKEEYANFNGEPVRHDLSEPPAGYRVPSAGQPYGISADKKGAPLARPAGLAPVGESWQMTAAFGLAQDIFAVSGTAGKPTPTMLAANTGTASLRCDPQ